MSAAFALWSVLVEPGKKTHITAEADIRISNAALDAELKDQSSRSSIKFTYEKAVAPGDDPEKRPPISSVLCSLTPGKVEHAPLDVIVNEDEDVEFEVIGKNAIYLTGNYILQSKDFPIYDELDSDDEDDNLLHGSELDASELDDEMDHDVDEHDDSRRFEEVESEGEKDAKKVEEPPSKKRPRESDAAESGTDGEQKLSKKQLKKLNKKLKAEDGAAVPNGESKAEAPKKDKAKREEKPEKVKKEQKGGEKAQGEKKAEKKKSTEDDAQKKKSETKETPTGLKIKDVKTGTGKAAKKGDSVSMRYVGKLMNGKVFDSNTKGSPFRFKLGLGEVIKGWDEGIAGMQIGGERLLVVPPKLAYGSKKLDGIPPNSTLRFECKLLAIN